MLSHLRPCDLGGLGIASSALFQPSVAPSLSGGGCPRCGEGCSFWSSRGVPAGRSPRWISMKVQAEGT